MSGLSYKPGIHSRPAQSNQNCHHQGQIESVLSHSPIYTDKAQIPEILCSRYVVDHYKILKHFVTKVNKYGAKFDLHLSVVFARSVAHNIGRRWTSSG